MRIKDELRDDFERWRHDAMQGDLSTRIVEYTEAWADSAESLMNERRDVTSAIAESWPGVDERYGRHESTYINAVQVLMYYWFWGDNLRAWHNARYGPSKKGASDMRRGGDPTAVITPFNWGVKES